MKPEPFEPQASVDRNPSATTGILFGALGLAGWFIVLLIMLAMPYEAQTGDGQRDLFIGFGNVVLFFIRAAIGLVGTSINGTLSIVGLILSSIGLQYEPKRRALIGVGIGIGGLLLGTALVVWRLTVFNVL